MTAELSGISRYQQVFEEISKTLDREEPKFKEVKDRISGSGENFYDGTASLVTYEFRVTVEKCQESYSKTMKEIEDAGELAPESAFGLQDRLSTCSQDITTALRALGTAVLPQEASEADAPEERYVEQEDTSAGDVCACLGAGVFAVAVTIISLAVPHILQYLHASANFEL